ncbi:hypothetical protein ACFYRJ_17450 [Streptomyces sp. NPDC005531]|uniref:hypothetical protein n=1 Tax=Streptomyces sp. NPDC005531 TaxID=3364722 RepID=UPI00368A6F3E
MPATPPRKPPMNPLAAGILGLAVGAGIVGAAWGITAGGGDAKPATFTLKGTFTLTDGALRTDDTSCRGTRGYDDIAEGTSVTVYDAAGKVAATGSLGKSSYTLGICEFKVTVDDVPKGEKFYQVEVSHRGKVQMTAKEAEAGEMAATLG